MGKPIQERKGNNNVPTNDKITTSCKLARMFHVLNYHRWHYVKKVLAHKKHHEERHASENYSTSIVYENDKFSKREIIENAQVTEVEAHKTDSDFLTKNFLLHSSAQVKSSSSTPLNQTKSSRASKIKKMITKEVTKRKGRHRRSSTCPIDFELEKNSLTNNQLEILDEELIARSKQHKTQYHGEKTCDLCSSMKIECRLGDVDLLIQDITKEGNNQIPLFRGKIDRSASFHHSKEFLDAFCVQGMNDHDFSLRVLDDPKSFLRDGFLNLKDKTSSKTKLLEKLGTFPIPINEIPNAKDSLFPKFYRLKAKSYIQEYTSQTRPENPSNSHSGHIVGRRFKDLRQKIKHLIKENRKERQRIAMDAVLHKVPYGHKVYEESVKETPACVSICETDSSNTNMKSKTLKRRSSSLDESLDKYCQLFATTSIGREDKVNTLERSRLKLMNEKSSKGSKRRFFGRILSSPDLNVFLSNCEDNDGYTSPNWRTSERKTKDDFNINVTGVMKFDKEEKSVCKDLAEDYVNIDFVEAFSLTEYDEEDTIDAQDDTKVESTKSFEVDKFDELLLPTVTTIESYPQMASYKDEGVSLKDLKLTQSEEMFNELSTSSCTKIDEDGEKGPIHNNKSHNYKHMQVTSYDITEFNYVRDILELSGYLGTQLLGTWYSSNQPVDPSLFIKLESFDLECSPEGKCSNHLLLFDMINEALLAIYERSVSYWFMPLCSCSRTYPMPKGYYVLEEVWNCINWYMHCSRHDLNNISLDYITARDLSKYDGWMNLQFDAECLALEVEELIFDDILNEFLS